MSLGFSTGPPRFATISFWRTAGAPAMETMRSAMGGMVMGGIGGTVLFLSAWAMMMVAMMVPSTLPLILLYRSVARDRSSLLRARVGMVALLVGYVAVWT